ncbi:MAG: penicillin-binding protein 2 [Candidatus Omnitrophota bacterium]
MDRVRPVFFGLSALFILVILGLFNLEIIQGRNLRSLGDKNCIRLVSQRGSRGRILDRNGVVLAGSKVSYDLLFMPQEGIREGALIERVSKILGKEYALELKKLRFDSSMPVVIANNLKLKEAVSLGQIKIDFPSLNIRSTPLRFYPNSKTACHILGYLGQIDRWRLTKLEDYGYKTRDIVGFGGIEEKYDYYLRDEEGGASFQVDHRGRVVRTLGFKPPVNGKDVELTIDIRIQRIAEDALGGKKGAVVIMNPQSGEVLALVSSPGFNPNALLTKDSDSSVLFNDPSAPLINRAISAGYPAGSIFKLVVAAAALENNKINLNTSFLCQGQTKVGRQNFKCWSTHGNQDIIRALAHSCNVFFYRVGLLVGAQLIHDYAIKLGLSYTTGFDLPYEKKGFIPSPLLRKLSALKNWFDGDTANLSIGQGEVLVTPIQIARMMAVFANGGYLVTPYITKSIDGRGILGHRKRPERVGFKPTTIKWINEGLKGVISYPEGTGNILSTVGVSIAGKTGTAQAPPKLSHAWFSGFFPVSNPRFVICVFLEHGGPGYYSCLVAKKIIENMLAQGLI